MSRCGSRVPLLAISKKNGLKFSGFTAAVPVSCGFQNWKSTLTLVVQLLEGLHEAMCGIWLECARLKDVKDAKYSDTYYQGAPPTVVSLNEYECSNVSIQSTIDSVVKRGPDAQNFTRFQVNGVDGTPSWVVTVIGSVLHLRGALPVEQPLVCPKGGHVFAWNGEIFASCDDELTVDEVLGDTVTVFRRLCRAADGGESLAEALEVIQGPFSFVFFNNNDKKLHYSRDKFGRRSLLQKLGRCGESLTLSSVGETITTGTDKLSYSQVPAKGVYAVDLLRKDGLLPTLIPWKRIFNITDKSTGRLHEVATPDALPSLGKLPASFTEVFEVFKKLLTEAVGRRMPAIPDQYDCAYARVAVLFSGGLDCTVLAALISESLPEDEPIDLINVAFENPRSLRASNALGISGERKSVYLVPDRITALRSYEELKERLPRRKFRLILVNVPYSEYLEQLDRVKRLVQPSDTVMDISIGIALWFAARGKGVCAGDSKPCSSGAKILISGLGADEQLGGYGRHRVAFKRGGFEGLVNELAIELLRISERNLGRDDRVISDHGKEARFPFLDEQLVDFLCRVPVAYKCDWRYDKGVGDKIILRLFAYHLGLHRVAVEPKRAIQFGSRTAKMQCSADKGQDKFGEAGRREHDCITGKLLEGGLQ